MIAAAYLRKSTDEGDKDADAKSVTRQLARCREFAEARGWTLPDAYVFTDDGVSGAAFTSQERPGFFALLDALEPSPPFQVLIVSEQSRIGRDTVRALVAIQQIEEAGVAVWSYLSGRQIGLANEDAETTTILDSLMASREQKRTGQRIRDARRLKVAQGYVVDSRAYGYIHTRVGSHVERTVNPAEAAVVVRIFEDVAAGIGFMRLAQALNREGATAPRDTGWGANTLKGLIRNRLYLGEAQHGRRKVVRRRGALKTILAPAAEVMTVTRPEWRIISDSQWAVAHARLARTRASFAPRTMTGPRPERGLASAHLLAGFLRCACGAAMSPVIRVGKNRTRRYYACAAKWREGRPCVHAVGLLNYDAITADVIRAFEGDLAAGLIAQVRTQYERDQTTRPAAKAQAEARLATVERELANLSDAIATGDAPRTLLKAMAAREAERADLLARLEHLQGQDLGGDVERLMLDALEHLSTDLQGPVAGARQALRRILLEPIVVTAVNEGGESGWLWKATAVLDRVIEGYTPAEFRVPDGSLPPA